MKVPSEVYIRLEETALICTVRYMGVGVPIRYPFEAEQNVAHDVEEESWVPVRIHRSRRQDSAG